ncbi:MAG: hypothetical protein COV48_04310, partial [Elusimicrobia bacterium CG11_big_fil_rev_8_21_14_0_20_64_6]
MPASASNRTIRFGKNVFWNLLGQGSLLALGFLLVPLLLRSLGSEGYALYALLGLLTGYLGLFNLGSQRTTQKFVAEHAARGETDRL